MFDHYKHLHFIGIGGSGISALAHLALAQGITVSGSDNAKNLTIEQLLEEGAQISLGHQKENVRPLTELVIYSEAIDKEMNPEYLEAMERGIKVMSYFDVLGEFSETKKTIVVTGTHGKTTTTAMLGQLLAEAGMDPTVIVGSRVPYFKNKNIRIGQSLWLVVEGCEYRKNFSTLQPYGMIVLNCEWEHVDYFKSEGEYISAFEELAKKIPDHGFMIFNKTDENCRKIAAHAPGQKIPVSYLDTQDIRLKIAGDFNKLNAAHALKMAEAIGVKREIGLMGLWQFDGTSRRMEIKGQKKGVLVIDDYGHHPTEVKATLRALKEKYPKKRLICVFQPHQYSRTYELLNLFKTSFEKADRVVIPNIYEARDTEEDKAKISAEKLSELIPRARWGKDFEQTLSSLEEELKEGDLLVTMGAGDVYRIGERFLKA